MSKAAWILCGAVVAGLTLFTILANGPRGILEVQQVDWSKVTDDPNEKLTISWMGAPYYPNAQEGAWIERMHEENFNLDLKPIYLSDYAIKKPMMFSGGLVPDVTWEANPINLQKDAKNGFLVPVPYEVIRRYAPDYVRVVNRIAPEAWMYSYYKEPGMRHGLNMGLPTTWVGGLYPPLGMWRLDWLKKVGMQRVPETLDEMHEAFLRFRRQNLGRREDAVGTCGMSTNTGAWWESFGEIFGAFGVLPYNWMARDGNVVWGGIQPETRQALALLRQWYSEGLIHPDFVSDVRADVIDKFLNGKCGYVEQSWGFDSMDLSSSGSLYSQIRHIDPRAELTPSRFPAGPEGKRGRHIWGGGGNVMSFGPGCRDKPQKIIRILRMWNRLATDERLSSLSRRGERGLHWQYRRPLLDPNTGRPVLIPGTDQPQMDPNSGIEYIGPYADPVYQRATLTVGFFAQFDVSVAWWEKYLSREAVEFRRTYQPFRFGHKDVFMKPDVLASSGRYILHLRELQKEYFCDIIRGVRPLEDFDQFVALWRRQGGDQLTREANELRADMKWVFQQVGARWRADDPR